VVVPDHVFVYRARHENVINAQTVELTVDLGYDMQMCKHFDLVTVDAHSLNGVECPEEREMAREETDFVKQWLRANSEESSTQWPLTIRTHLPRTENITGDYEAHLTSTETHESLNADLKSRFPRVIA